MGGLLSKHPVVEFEGDQTGSEIAFKVLAALTIVEHLLRLEVADEFLHIVVGSLARQELARRDIEESHTTGSLAKLDGTEEVVLLVIEHGILHSHTWRHQFRDASLHQLLRQLRIFQLVADGYAASCTDELRQIGVQRMMRKTSHLVALVIAVVAVGQRDAQYLRGNNSVVAIRLVEVATTEQQQRLRVFRLEVEELFHHRSELLTVFLCHLFYDFGCKGTKNNEL